MRKGVFLSYEIADQHAADYIKVHLNARQEELGIRILDFSQIPAGADIEKEKSKILQSVKIVILLLSANFLASDKVKEDLDRILELVEKESVVILPIIISRCILPDNLSIFQPLNYDELTFAQLNDEQKASFLVYVGNRVKITLKNVFTKAMKEIKTKEKKTTVDVFAKEEMEKNIKQLSQSIAKDKAHFKDNLQFSLAKMNVISILKNAYDEKQQGLQIRAIYKMSKTKKRKFIFQALDEMEKWGYVEKERISKDTYWSLTKKGLDFSKQVYGSFLFN